MRLHEIVREFLKNPDHKLKARPVLNQDWNERDYIVLMPGRILYKLDGKNFAPYYPTIDDLLSDWEIFD